MNTLVASCQPRAFLAAASWLLCILIPIVSARPVAAQCPGRWVYSDEQVFPGVNGTVYCQLAWDPDGPGPLPENLIIGGAFTNAGGIPVQNIAMWDGITWTDMGAGITLGTDDCVSGLRQYNGSIVAVVSLRSSGLPYLTSAAYRRTNATWQPVSFPRVRAAAGWADFGGELIAANVTDGAQAWNGTSWRTLTNASGYTPVSVADVVVWQGALYGAGQFRSPSGATVPVAKWGETGWQPEGDLAAWSGTSTGTRLFVTPSGLILGGTLAVNNVGCLAAQWNGQTWTPMASRPGYLSGTPTAFCRYDNDLMMATARFFQTTQTGGWYAGLYKWNGTYWIPVDSDDAFRWGTYIHAITPFRGKLALVGRFTFIAGTCADNVVFRDAAWHPIGTGFDSNLRAVSSGESGLHFAGTSFGAGGKTSVGVTTRRSAGDWSALGQWLDVGPPMTSNSPSRAVFLQITEWRNRIFATRSGSPIWMTWALSADAAAPSRYLITGQGDSLFGRYRGALVSTGSSCSVYDNFSGAFAGYPPMFWNGTTGGSFGGGIPVSGSTQSALAEHQGDLFVAGTFRVNNVDQHVARFDGARWSYIPLATSAFPTFSSMVSYRGELYLAGSFSGTPSPNVVRWNGSQWLPVGLGTNGQVNAMAVHADKLYVAGEFQTVGNGLLVNRIAMWDGNAWHALGSGIDGAVFGLASHHGELIAVGNFLQAGGQHSSYWARWSPDGVPPIDLVPAPASAACGQPALFAASSMPGYENVSTRWQLQDAAAPAGWRDLADGPLFLSGVQCAAVTDSGTPTLSLTPSTNFGSLAVRAILSNPCGSAPSDPAVLTVVACSPSCNPDLNGDGAADQTDVATLIDVLSGGPNPDAVDPDFNRDGMPNQADLDALITAIAGGPCP